MSSFGKKTDMIAESWPFRCLGIAFSFCLVCTFFYWNARPDLISAMSFESNYSLCWPFFQNCQPLKALTSPYIDQILFFFLAISIISIGMFFFRKLVGAAIILCSLGHLIKFLIVLHDFRLMGNYHFMEFGLFLVFLFSRKNTSINVKATLIAFYFSAGFLKFNTEWISGAALPFQWHGYHSITGWMKNNGFIYVASSYAIIIETVLSFGILSKNKRVFYFCISQLALFHLLSIDVVGYFYPGIMLSFFPFLIFDFHHTLNSSNKAAHLGVGAIRTFSKPFVGILTLFLMFQFIPKFLNGDLALTKHASVFRLTMLDATPTCQAKLILNTIAGTKDLSYSPDAVTRILRIQCHPYSFFYVAKKLCQKHSRQEGFKGLHLQLKSKRTTDKSYFQIIDEPNICSDKISYSLFYNSWILSKPL